MTTEAEIAAGRTAWNQRPQAFSLPWEEFGRVNPVGRDLLIADAMAVVRAYQRAAWREPTEEDIRERRPMLVTNQYMRGGDEWSPWSGPRVSEWYMLSDQFDRIRIQVLPPLPDPVETTDAKL